MLKVYEQVKSAIKARLNRCTFLTFKTLRGRLTFNFLILSCCLIFLMALVFLHQATSVLNKTVFTHFNSILQLEADRLEQILQRQARQLHWLAQQPRLQAALTNPDNNNSAGFLQTYNDVFVIDALSLHLFAGAQGQLIASTAPTSPTVFPIQYQHWQQQSPHWHLQDKELWFILPLQTATETAAGILIAQVPQQALFSPLPASAHQVLASAHLYLSEHHPHEYQLTGNNLYQYQKNETVLFANWRWVLAKELLLIIEVPKTEALSIQTDLVKIGFMTTLFALLLAGIASYHLIQRLIMPLWQLINVTCAIRDGDLSQRCPSYRFYEFDQLSDMLNRMSNRLQHMLQDLEQQIVERTALSQAYERFVPRQFLKLLDKKSITEVKLGDQIEKEMTIFFSDIRDFTQLSETLTPQANFDFINDYLKVMEPVIYEHSGLIDKYIGDAIMALFPGNADNAVQAAIAMIKHLELFNQSLKQEYPIKIGIGLNSGQLMLGVVGGENRMDGTVIADAVNLASRVEALTKTYGTSLLITTETYLKLANPQAYHIRLIDAVQVKGKSETVTVYEVYDADAPEMVALKDATREDFEVAIMIYENDDYAEARPLFEAVLAENPNDHVAQIYLERCTQALNSAMPAMPTVLIVDDTAFTLVTLYELLSNNEYHVLVAEDGEKALEIIEKQTPHLILLDIMMPGADGFEICRRLQEQTQTKDIPIIFITALSELDSKIKGFKAGAVDYITKPFQSEEVLARVKTHISMRHMYYKLQQKNHWLELDRQELLDRLRFYKRMRHDTDENVVF